MASTRSERRRTRGRLVERVRNSVRTASPSCVLVVRGIGMPQEPRHRLGAAVEGGRHVHVTLVELDLAEVAGREARATLESISSALALALAARPSTTATRNLAAREEGLEALA